MNEHYKALTRAYRPQTFEEIVSQEHVSNTLKNAIKSNRLSHAYMFCGPRGVGKTSMARVLARVVNEVEAEVDGESLGRTLNIVEMDAASNRKIEDVRSLKEVVRVPPQNGKYKIFIIDEVHMLTKEAFNALLKTLEEPPAHAIFIFATTEPHKVLPTILSRVQRFDFKRIGVGEIVERLRAIADKESIEIDEESLLVIAKRADGALRDALGLMDQAISFCGTTIEYKELLNALNVVDHNQLFAFTEAAADRDAHTGLSLVKSLLDSGTDIQEFLVGLTEHIRNLYVASDSDRLHLIEATDEMKKRYTEQAGRFAEEDLMRILHLVSETQHKLKDARQPRVQFEILMLKLVHMNASKDLNTLLGELERLKKNSTDGKAGSGSKATKENQTDMNETVQRESGEQKPVSNKTASIHSSANAPREKGPGKRSPKTGGNRAIAPNDAATGLERPEAETDREEPDGSDAETGAAAVPGGTEKAGGPQPNENPKEPGGAELVKKSEKKAVQDGAEEKEDELFGRPSLGDNGLNRAGESPQQRNPKSDSVEQDASSKQSEEKSKVRSVEELKSSWPRFLERLKSDAPQMLYFQMQRVEIKALQGRELTIGVDNGFASRLIEENRMMLSKLLKEQTGVPLRICCRIERSDGESPESVDLYEKFNEIQKKDPQIQTLVELFGAELEY